MAYQGLLKSHLVLFSLFGIVTGFGDYSWQKSLTFSPLSEGK